MAIALRRIRDRVRDRVQDDSSPPVWDTIKLDQIVSGKYLELQASLPAPGSYAANAFTITAGLDTFTLPATVLQYTGNDGGAEYNGDIEIQLASTGAFLRKITMEEMDAFKNWQIPVLIADRPAYFALYEDKAQLCQGRIYPGARSGESCHLWAGLSADDVRDYVGAGTDDMDDVEVLLSREASLALELAVATDLIERATDDVLGKLGLNPKVAASWRMDASRLLWAEEARRHYLDSVGRAQRWIS